MPSCRHVSLVLTLRHCILTNNTTLHPLLASCLPTPPSALGAFTPPPVPFNGENIQKHVDSKLTHSARDVNIDAKAEIER